MYKKSQKKKKRGPATKQSGINAEGGDANGGGGEGGAGGRVHQPHQNKDH